MLEPAAFKNTKANLYNFIKIASEAPLTQYFLTYIIDLQGIKSYLWKDQL